MRGSLAGLFGGLFVLAASLHASNLQSGPAELGAILERLAESVERYYARAQSIICIENVRLQSLGHDLLPDRTPARNLQYELRVAWDPAAAGDTPEATVLRQLVKVNGRSPRPRDEPGCMDPKAVSLEPLAMFLPRGQEDYIFTLAGTRRMDGRQAVMIDYKSREVGPEKVTWNKDCFSMELPGRSRGRVWVDAETGDVLRLDEHLTGMVDYTLPSEHRIPGGPIFVTVERLDSSIRYRPVPFEDPDEVVMLPASVTTLTVVRNAGVPRLRTTQTFSQYRRFITGGRIVQ